MFTRRFTNGNHFMKNISFLLKIILLPKRIYKSSISKYISFENLNFYKFDKFYKGFHLISENIFGHGQSIRTWELRFPELRRETICGGAKASSSFRFFIFFVGWRRGTVTATESISSNTEPPIFVSFHASLSRTRRPFFLFFLYFSILLYQPLQDTHTLIIVRSRFISVLKIRSRFHRFKLRERDNL